MIEQSRAEFERRLVEKASNDNEFRKKLIDSPKDTLMELLGMELPADLILKVHEEDENTLHFVLPLASGEISSAELAGISGGMCWSDCACQGNSDPHGP